MTISDSKQLITESWFKADYHQTDVEAMEKRSAIVINYLKEADIKLDDAAMFVCLMHTITSNKKDDNAISDLLQDYFEKASELLKYATEGAYYRIDKAFAEVVCQIIINLGLLTKGKYVMLSPESCYDTIVAIMCILLGNCVDSDVRERVNVCLSKLEASKTQMIDLFASNKGEVHITDPRLKYGLDIIKNFVFKGGKHE